ncbi:hypothetical protein J6590_061101 [Homalodisca vitripennis]|nr:hypothetical protein J6590_061101 [Homalodisca vitripennis]
MLNTAEANFIVCLQIVSESLILLCVLGQRHLHHCELEEGVGTSWRSRLSRSRINSAVYIAQSSTECDPLMPPDCAVSLRRAKSAGNLRDQQLPSHDAEFHRQDSDPSPPSHHFELPVLSVSVATEKPFVEQHL